MNIARKKNTCMWFLLNVFGMHFKSRCFSFQGVNKPLVCRNESGKKNKQLEMNGFRWMVPMKLPSIVWNSPLSYNTWVWHKHLKVFFFGSRRFEYHTFTKESNHFGLFFFGAGCNFNTMSKLDIQHGPLPPQKKQKAPKSAVRRLNFDKLSFCKGCASASFCHKI